MPLVPATAPRRSRAAGADHRATSRTCRWCRPPCRVEAVPLVLVLAHRARSKRCRWCRPPRGVEAGPLVPTTVPRRRRVAGAGPPCRVEAVPLVPATVPGRSRAAGAGPACRVEDVPLVPTTVPRRSRAAGAGHRAASRTCRWCRPPCRVEALPLTSPLHLSPATVYPCKCKCGKCGSAESEHPCGFAADGKCGTKCGSAVNLAVRRPLASVASSGPVQFFLWRCKRSKGAARKLTRHSPPHRAGCLCLRRRGHCHRVTLPSHQGAKTSPDTPCTFQHPGAMPGTRSAFPRAPGGHGQQAGAVRPFR